MAAPTITLMNAEQMARALDDLARATGNDRRGDPREPELALIGIRNRGVPLAVRLARLLSEKYSLEPPVGAIDITLYRDDLSQIARTPILRGTDVPFAIDGKELILVDDVLFTGRTVRAAMDVLCDLGRPAAIRLAVLVDRGHRELPIQADHCGLTLTTELNERIDVLLTETDGVDEVRKEMLNG
jgi:pyrimidine operon attenuation protein/uracil phosphoribosyltransferase